MTGYIVLGILALAAIAYICYSVAKTIAVKRAQKKQ